MYLLVFNIDLQAFKNIETNNRARILTFTSKYFVTIIVIVIIIIVCARRVFPTIVNPYISPPGFFFFFFSYENRPLKSVGRFKQPQTKAKKNTIFFLNQ